MRKPIQKTHKKKWYRIVDGWWEPYHSWYNETSLREIAECIYSLWVWDDLWDDMEYYWETEEDIINTILKSLRKGERDFIFIVEESDYPFENEWYDDDSDYEDENGKVVWHNYSAKTILKYARTRDDLWEYSNKNLVDFVWSFTQYGCCSSKPISDILDEFSMIDYKDELFDYLNNLLFTKASQLTNAIRKRINEEKWISVWPEEVAELASEFVDWKELYDLDYND